MAIRGLKPSTVASFTGKDTLTNLAQGDATSMLSAKNVLILADQQVRRMPGYSLLVATGLGPVRSMFQFERSVDQKTFILAHIADKIVAMNAAGGKMAILSSGESATPFQFVASAFICYGSNGVNAYRFVDNAGVLTKYAWGISAPLAAPAISTSTGSLTLIYGRRYVRSYVSKYTDSLGIQRVHVGAPSPYSSHTGPVSNVVVTLSDMTSSADPQVTHQWIFATTDSPFDTSSTYLFAAEIPNTQTTFGDQLQDVDLDDTRLAPFDNNPAPPSAMLSTFENRIWATQVNQIRLSGYAEITVGIPQEAWPLSLFFNIPAGSRLATAQIAASNGTQFLVGTTAAWFDYTGYDASTFTEADNVATPGPAGPLAVCLTPHGVVWLSISRQLYLDTFTSTYLGAAKPSELSERINQPLAGTVSMQDITHPETARLHWYSFGKQQFLICIASTTGDPINLDWMQVWSVSTVSGNMVLAQTDKFPTDLISSSANAELNGVPYLLTGDPFGNLYQFPNGFQDNKQPYQSVFSTAWTNLSYEGEKRFYFIDIILETSLSLEDMGNAVSTMKVFALVSDAPKPRPQTPQMLDLQLLPTKSGQTGYVVRANLQAQGVAWGRYLRIWVELPDQVDDDQVIESMATWFAPKFQGIA